MSTEFSLKRFNSLIYIKLSVNKQKQVGLSLSSKSRHAGLTLCLVQVVMLGSPYV
jgi:hypothetical protein